eukprot:2603609-Pyramimonas_sp.AAC.1
MPGHPRLPPLTSDTATSAKCSLHISRMSLPHRPNVPATSAKWSRHISQMFPSHQLNVPATSAASPRVEGGSITRAGSKQ